MDIVERLHLEREHDVLVCSEAADYIEWQRRLLQWCKVRLRRQGYAETLDSYIAAGPTVPDMTPIVQSDQ